MIKTFRGFLILDLDTNEMQVRKKKPYKLSSNLVPVSINIKVKIPDPSTFVLNGDITVSEKQVEEMFIEKL